MDRLNGAAAAERRRLVLENCAREIAGKRLMAADTVLAMMIQLDGWRALLAELEAAPADDQDGGAERIAQQQIAELEGRLADMQQQYRALDLAMRALRLARKPVLAVAGADTLARLDQRRG